MGMNTAAVQRLYVAYFNRPADPVSLAVYEAMLPADRVATQAELLVVAETYFSPSAEYTSNFEGKSNSQTVNQLYQNIFGREAEAGGLVSWATQLTDGSITVAELALQLSYSAQGTDAAVVDARIEAATTFTNGLDTAEEITGYSGDAAAAQGRAYLAQISGTLPTTAEAVTAQKDAAVAGADASIAAAIEAGNAVAGSSFTLQTAQDSITGTAGNDAVDAVVIAAGATGTTIQAGDQVAMSGGVDTLNISFSGDGGNAGGVGHTISGVVATDLEKVLLSNFDTNVTGVTQIDTTLLSGLTDVGFTSSGANGDTNFSGMTSLVNGQMYNGSADLTLTHAAAATSGASSISLDVRGATAGTFTAAGIETLTVNSDLTASTLTAITASSMTNLDVTGSANLTVSTALDFVDNASSSATAVDGTLDASAFTGALSVGFATGDNVTVTGGSGADTFAFTTGFTVSDTVDGGDGRDTISVSTANATDLTSTTLANVSNVETLFVTTTNNAAAFTGTGVTVFDTIKTASKSKDVVFTGDAGVQSATATISFVLNGTSYTSTADLSGNAAADAVAASNAVAATIDALSGFAATADGTDTVTVTSVTGDAVEIVVTDQTGAAAAEGAYTDFAATGLTDQTVEISTGGDVTLSLADASGSSDAVTINLTSPSADAGFSQTIDSITVANVETLTINTSGLTASTSDYIVSALSDSGSTDLTTLNITGSSSLDLQGTITASDLTTVDASTFTGDLILDGVAEDQTITGGTGGDLFIMAANLDDDDTIDGGDGTDTVSATATGLTATTGALSTTSVETLNLTNTGTAVIDASGITGAGEIAVAGAATSTTITNLAAGTAVGIGFNNVDGTLAGILSVALADATGTSDALTVNLNDTGGTTNTVDLRASGVETVTLDVTDATDPSNGDYNLDVDALNATSIIISGSEGDDANTISLNGGTTLDTDTSSVTATAYNGILTATAASTTATTFDVKGDRAHNLTGSGLNDTFTVGATTGADLTIDGGAGSGDVLNITFGDGTQTLENVSNVETLNITVSGSADVDMTAANELDGIIAATNINFSGGNSLSSVVLGADGTVELTGASNLILDYSGYTGTTSSIWADDAFDHGEDAGVSLQVIGTSGIGDSLLASYDADTDATVQLNMQGVETLTTVLGNSAVELDMDMSLVTGLTLMNISDTSTESVELSSLAAGVTVDVTATEATNTTVEIQRAVVSGTESQSVNVSAASADDGVAIVMADIETLVVKPETANQVDLDLSSVSMTASGATMAVNFIGAHDVELVGLGSDVTTIDASGMSVGGSVIQTGRSLTAASTYTGSDGADTFMMLNTGDVLDGGAGSDTLDIDLTAILGGVNVDLSATDQVVSMNGGATSGTVTNFENVDVSGYVGFGAVLSGNSSANSLIGTDLADQLSGGSGNDTLKGGAGADTLTGGAGDDAFVVTTGITVDTVVDFTVNEDDVDFELASLNAAGGITAGETDTLVTFVATTAPTDTLSTTTVTVATIDSDSSDETAIEGANVILLHGGATTFASVGDAVDAFEDSGDFTITHESNIANDDSFVFAYENSTTGNVHIAVASFENADDESTGGADVIADNDLKGTDLMILTGVTDVTTLDAADFDFI